MAASAFNKIVTIKFELLNISLSCYARSIERSWVYSLASWTIPYPCIDSKDREFSCDVALDAYLEKWKHRSWF